MGLLVPTGTIPNRGEPVLPEIRHIQVDREWCPETQAGFRIWLATACRMVRNTYQRLNTLALTVRNLNYQLKVVTRTISDI